MGLTVNAVARDVDLPATRLHEIIHERRGVSAETAIVLGTYFGQTPEFWMNAQKAYSCQKNWSRTARTFAGGFAGERLPEHKRSPDSRILQRPMNIGPLPGRCPTGAAIVQATLHPPSAPRLGRTSALKALQWEGESRYKGSL